MQCSITEYIITYSNALWCKKIKWIKMIGLMKQGVKTQRGFGSPSPCRQALKALHLHRAATPPLLATLRFLSGRPEKWPPISPQTGSIWVQLASDRGNADASYMTLRLTLTCLLILGWRLCTSLGFSGFGLGLVSFSSPAKWTHTHTQNGKPQTGWQGHDYCSKF